MNSQLNELSSGVISSPLRPYQVQVAKAIIDSALNKKGLSFSVEIARQGGKNELSSHLEILLLTIFAGTGGDIVKCSPTFKPQTRISIERLEKMLSIFGFGGLYGKSDGYIIQLGLARCLFLSADRQSSVVGHTAGILLEVDEAQDVDKDKFRKEFAPMASSTNTTMVFYGTTWDDFSLLEEVKQSNLEAARKDGIQRHFSFDWHEVSKYNPDYGSFVESEQSRLGEEHPLFRTQYRLLAISDGGAAFFRIPSVPCSMAAIPAFWLLKVAQVSRLCMVSRL